MSKSPGITIRQPVRAQAATFTPGNVPTAADYGPWEANIGGFVWLSDGVTNTPFPDGWVRNGSQEQPITTRTLIYSFQQDMSSSAVLEAATITQDCYISFSGDITEVFEVIFIVNGQRLPAIESQPYQFLFSLEDYPANLTSFTVIARLEFEDGSKERISSSFTVSRVVNTPIFITCDRDTAVDMTGQAGGTAPDLVFNLDNTGTELTPTYAASDDVSWITPTVVGDVLTLAFPVSALAAGAYQGTVTVTSAGLVPLIITVNLTVTAAATYQLVSSDASGFTNPLALSGGSLAGSKYIGVLPATGISSVAWNIDGALVKTRTGTPFDLGAESTATAAAAYDTSSLSNGTHTATATITPTGGARNYILQSQTLSAAPWSNFALTPATLDTVAGPSGQTLMFNALATTAAVQHTHSQLVTKPSAASLPIYCRVWLKPKSGAEWYYWRLYLGRDSTLAQKMSVNIRLDAGNVSVYNQVSDSANGWTLSTYTVTAESDGSYRVDMYGTCDTTANVYVRLTAVSTDLGTLTFTQATANTGAYMAWQLDFDAAPTAYTTTVGSAVIGSGGTPTTLSATFTTQNAEKILEVDKSQITFIGTFGAASPAAQTITLKPTVGTAAWTSVEVIDMPWLSVTASGSAEPAIPSTVTLTPTTGALAVGQYTGTLRFSATGYTPADVAITFNVGAAAPTYNLYYSPTAVGAADYALLQGATATRFHLWIASTAAPRVPLALAAGGTDSFRWWNTATTIAEEATKFVTLTVGAGGTCTISSPTGLVENAAGPKNYHWVLTVSGVTSRGDVGYNYGTTTSHKGDYGVYLRVDRSLGKLGSQPWGSTFLSAKEIAFVQHPACKGLLFAFGWRWIDQNASPGGAFFWTQIDACIALAKSYGKKAGFRISPQHWGQPPTYILNNPNLWDSASSEGNPDWRHATVRDAWKRLWRAISARYDSNPDVVLFTTDEAWWAPSAAWKALGITENALSAAYHSINLEIMTQVDPATGTKPFRKTHWFVGGNQAFASQAPGGNFDQLVNAGIGVYQPDGLSLNKSLIGTQGLILQYKGRMGSLLFGDGGSMGGANFTGTFPNAPMASYKINADYRVPNAVAEYNPGTTFWGASAAECMQNNYFAVMATLTGVGVNPPNPGWDADITALLNYVQANGYPNTTHPSNLALKV